MSRCYVVLSGGLSNQLFQAACGFSYAKSTSKDLILCTKYWSASQGNHPNFYSDSIFKNFKLSDDIVESVEIYMEPQFNFSDIPTIDGDISLNGYFQSLKYFEWP